MRQALRQRARFAQQVVQRAERQAEELEPQQAGRHQA